MSTTRLLLPFLLALSTAAHAQTDKCNTAYTSCVDRCVAKPQADQALCSQSCEALSNKCYGQLYGLNADGSAPDVQSEGAAEGAAKPHTNEASSKQANKGSKRKKKRVARVCTQIAH